MQQTAQENRPIPTAGFAHPATNVAALGVEPGMSVADFGAGSGHYTLAIAAALKGLGAVYAVDVQRDLLRRIKTEADKHAYKVVNVIWGDLEQPGASKVSDHSCDLVLISNLLFQVPDKVMPVMEAKRIMKPGGRVAIIDWTESFGGMGPIEAHVFKKEAALALARECGFSLLKEFAAGAHHYGLIFKQSV